MQIRFLRLALLASSALLLFAIIFFCWWNLSLSIIPLQKNVVSSVAVFDLAAELPKHRTEASGAVCSNKLYVLGGLDYFMQSFNDMWVYDNSIKQWKKENTLPVPLNHASVVSNDSLLFVIGGFGPLGFRYRGVNIARYTPQQTCYAYNTLRHTWKRLADLPSKCGAGGACILNDTIYYAGGVGADLNVSAQLYAYSVAANKWFQLPNFKQARDHHRLEVLNRCLYVISGRQDDLRHTLRSVERYQLDTRQWSFADSIPTARGGIATQVYHGKIYVFGGEFVWSCSDEIDCYDPIKNKWMKLDKLPEARHGIISGILNDTIHLISGGRHSRISVSGIHRTFKPLHD